MYLTAFATDQSRGFYCREVEEGVLYRTGEPADLEALWRGFREVRSHII
jgi:hypothetical protein